MKNHKFRINNSYESSSSGSASSTTSSVNDQVGSGSINFEMTTEGHNLSDLMLPPADNELYNTSAEEGIFPNINSCATIAAPSYAPEYDYYNEYSTTPLVYSWMPIVPGFIQKETDSLHNFDHRVKRLQPRPLNISIDEESTVISDQNIKYEDCLVINNSDSRLYILNNSNGMTFNHQLDDSCNAMDLDISCHKETKNLDLDLSFDGKISELTSKSDKNVYKKCIEIDSSTPQFTIIDQETISTSFKDKEQLTTNDKKRENDDDDNDRINENLELLKEEDSTKLVFLNEKSPDIIDDGEMQNKNDQEDKMLTFNEEGVVEVKISKPNSNKSAKECDSFILKRIQSSLSELCPPPSISTLPLSLSEMLSLYNRNLHKKDEMLSEVKSNSLFIPSHSLKNSLTEMEWPEIFGVKAHGISYNRSTDCEEIEFLTVKYTERFVRSETTTSFNHKCGPTSAKKRIEKLKLLAQSPGSRLSHLANRRKVFSSASLKTTSTTTSQKTSSGCMLIDKSKLYQKKKRNSSKKKTPGKRKTPKSAKREQSQFSKSSGMATSKRALFTSPAKTTKCEILNLSRISRDIPSRGQLPIRNLFSPTHSCKRRRSPSPDQDVENQFGKNRRLDSPSKLGKSKSFSIIAPSSSSGSLDEHFRKTLFYRTQSEMVLNQNSENTKNNLGFRKPLSEVDKKKLLWTASSVLQSKQINRDHLKFKEYMSMLCKLVKKIFTDFYNPSKSMSAQMTKFANLMVYYVIQGRTYEEIYLITRKKIEEQNPMKVSGYIGQEEYIKNQFIRKNSSLLMLSTSCSSLNFSHDSDSLNDSNFDKSGGSDKSLNHSSSKINETCVLRENVLSHARENSAKKPFGGSDSNLSKLSTSTPSNILKAKRQISF